MAENKVTILDFKHKKENGGKITMLTAYDCPMARLIDSAGIDAVLVGDSVGMVVLGYDSTVRVTMEEMIHHCKAVRRGVTRAFLIGDMPFMSYQVSDEDAVRNAGRFVKEAGCEAVKVEGGREVSSRVSAIIDAGIPVLGHIGLTPQTASKLGGYRVQGRSAESAGRLIDDAAVLEKAGCFALVLECVPASLAGKITGNAGIPTIGIGAGRHCDGQVLVTHDIIGYFDKFIPKFVKQYAKISGTILEAVRDFKNETESGSFPGDEHSF
ncbi:MAG: 3-methyl-2-oxobutanoate hydroxymethyltransferase [Candidatus Makaraimicrobium thalassicum]|nr:MAG: 3-methyl-2-oxobutanoate hydroxymethyltransferase [Candidatus Omnitrophota bacterium]